MQTRSVARNKSCIALWLQLLKLGSLRDLPQPPARKLPGAPVLLPPSLPGVQVLAPPSPTTTLQGRACLRRMARQITASPPLRHRMQIHIPLPWPRCQMLSLRAAIRLPLSLPSFLIGKQTTVWRMWVHNLSLHMHMWAFVEDLHGSNSSKSKHGRMKASRRLSNAGQQCFMSSA